VYYKSTQGDVPLIPTSVSSLSSGSPGDNLLGSGAESMLLGNEKMAGVVLVRVARKPMHGAE
jgi:hypothetical protein